MDINININSVPDSSDNFISENLDLNIKTANKEHLLESVEENICTCGKNPGGPCMCKAGEDCISHSDKSKDCKSCDKKSRCCFTKGTHKLEVFDWLSDLPESQNETQMVEVQFKNTRKGYYLNSNNLELFKGDVVAVEASPGHDIGEITLTGKLVLLQMKKNNYRMPQGEQHRRVYRIAKPSDIEKCNAAKAQEYSTMLRAREIAEELGLQMKISDVEYQGDGNKAIFYYIADERVDFRQLIKVYAENFRVKIEMKQIGARQEAGRVGGIGPCGRELCCSNSMSSFVSVSTTAARYQDISLNPQKLAGQCGKLKCCLNYEVDVYVEAQRGLPARDIVLETKDASFYHFKTDILSGTMTYSTSKDFAANLAAISKDRVYEIIQMNKRGNKPLSLVIEENVVNEKETPKDILEQENINRFDNNSPNGRKKMIVKGNRRDRDKANEKNKKQEPAEVQNAVQSTNPEQNAESNKNKQRNRNRNNRNRNNRNKNGSNKNNNDKGNSASSDEA